MCFSNIITWKKCGHFVVRREMCEDALARTPPQFCNNAFAPVSTDIDESNGVCPDRAKHPPGPGQHFVSAWTLQLGITRTSGDGNAWYRSGQGQT
ncbi:hypothetical protein CKM354_000670100 [Cercospora kikuchii]|uniref:Uncharacterized protein n=1 Tax=Cercospora kikuchii TaxID=84275 RepID=A0A9P3CIH6_9PEZI|nr:uncharacterized protein CKM354_000670100 [Cercospora kikuchii]GIZ43474.1 hypothetical protein CKM354_000670100 [Cercospora kikuchii]